MKPMSLIRRAIERYNQFARPLAAAALGAAALALIASCGPPAPESPEALKNSSAAAPVNATPEVEVSGVIDTASMLERMADPASPSIYDPSETVAYTSSHSTDYGLIDADYFQGEKTIDGKTWKILFDRDGPGCLTRIWMSGNTKGRLRIYFDGEEQPRIDATVDDFFSENMEPFTSLFVLSSKSSGGGQVCYFPMPFEKHCLIVIYPEVELVQYQVQASIWPPEIEVKTFDPKLDARTRGAKEKAFNFISSVAYNTFKNTSKTNTSVTIQPGEQAVLASLRGPGAIEYLQFEMPEFDSQKMMKLHLKAYWDEVVEPAIDVSMADFFNAIDNTNGWSIPPLGGIPDQKLVFTQFYMPFFEKAQLFIESDLDKPITIKATYKLTLDELPPNTMYFFARSKQRDMGVGLMFPFLQFEGRGRYVGMSLKAVASPMEPKHFYMEGDDYFFIDGEELPSIQGTGLDNYFNGFNRMTSVSRFWSPTNGCWVKDDEDGGKSYCFRIHYLDAIPFHTSLTRVEEIGCPEQFYKVADANSAVVHYEWTQYWYGVPQSAHGKRHERLYHYGISSQPNQAPTENSPVMIDQKLVMPVNTGDWWLHLSPVWDVSQVQHVFKSSAVQPPQPEESPAEAAGADNANEPQAETPGEPEASAPPESATP
ncbi:MAG: DUF2961 domain-containing protein [bacterium]|nr:DUF2961 domain-containing protein [bacterium]